MHTPLRGRKLLAFQEFLKINDDLLGLQSKKEKHEMAIKNIQEIIKMLKSNRNSNISQILGGQYIIPMDNKKAIKMLQEKKKELEIGIKALDEQLMHRSDGYESTMLKMRDYINNKVPPEEEV